jgi:hypothetical protein
MLTELSLVIANISRASRVKTTVKKLDTARLGFPVARATLTGGPHTSSAPFSNGFPFLAREVSEWVRYFPGERPAKSL